MPVTALTNLGQIAKSAVVPNMRANKILPKEQVIFPKDHEGKFYGFNAIYYTTLLLTALLYDRITLLQDNHSQISDFKIIEELQNRNKFKRIDDISGTSADAVDSPRINVFVNKCIFW